MPDNMFFDIQIHQCMPLPYKLIVHFDTHKFDMNWILHHCHSIHVEREYHISIGMERVVLVRRLETLMGMYWDSNSD